MMRALLFCSLWISVTLYAQTDTLEYVLASASSDTSRIDLLIQWSRDEAPQNFDASKDLGERAYKLASDLNDQRRMALAQKAIGLSYGYQSKPQEARVHYLQAAELFGLLGDRLSVADMFMNCGVEFYFSGLADSSMHYYLMALPVYQELNDPRSLGRIYNNMALSYRALAMKEKAIVHFRKSLENKHKIEDEEGVMNTALNIANLYRLDDVIDSSMHYASLGLELSEKLEDLLTKALFLHILSLCQMDLGEAPQALELGLESLDLIELHGDTKNKAKIHASLSTIYYQLGYCDSALVHVQAFETLGEGLKMYRERREAMRVSASCAAASGDYAKAFAFQSLELAYDDSVDAAEQQERLGEITARYEESVRMGALLEKENQLARKEAENNQLFAWTAASVAALALALVGILILVLQSRKRRTEQELHIRQQMNEIERLRERLLARGNEVGEDTVQEPLSLEEVNSHLINPLTDRELEVLRGIAQGKSNQQIADELFVSINTIKTHVNKVYEKLDVNNRTQATLKATKLRIFG